MTFDEAIKHRNTYFPDGTIDHNGVRLKIFVVPKNNIDSDSYLIGISNSLAINKVNDEFAKGYSTDNIFGLCGFAEVNDVLFHYTII